MYINNLGHMTKMAAMPIYGKNPSKIIFSETNRLISRKLGVRHRWLKYSNVYINHDPVMTLTKFMARSAWVACASELGKLLKCHLKEKANRKLANGQNIEDSEKRKWPKGLSAPALELNTIIFKHFYWYMQLISGERLQDHWSSGLFIRVVIMIYLFVLDYSLTILRFTTTDEQLIKCEQLQKMRLKLGACKIVLSPQAILYY